MRIACVQMEHAGSVDEALSQAARHVAAAAGDGAELIVLPEYFFAPIGSPPAMGPLPETASRVREFLAAASRDSRAAVAGNAVSVEPEGRFNVVYVYDDGRLVAQQRKVHPMPREVANGLVGGSALDSFDVRGVRGGVLVCADIFYPEASRVLSLRGAEVLLNPVMSPFHHPDPTKAAREAVYVARAWDAGAFVLKAGGFTRRDPRVAGRSLVASPWGLVARYGDDFTAEVLFADLDLDALRDFRKSHRGFSGRAPGAYRALVDE